MRRPTIDGYSGAYVTTPRAGQTMLLLGAELRHGGVALTRDEKRTIDQLYGFVPAERSDVAGFMQAGADVNAMRHAEADGLRMVAWLARRCPPGEDPLKVLVQLAIEAGWDVDPADIEWAQDEAEEE